MNEALPSSFRDPSGFVFARDGVIHRQVNTCYQEHYERLMGSGLYAGLVQEGLLLPHEEVAVEHAASGGYKILLPQQLSFISHPYEWCFGQLRDAALLTLDVAVRALSSEMILKDATAYNVQFEGGRPRLIDTLSFENYREGQPWVAYGQFCRHFLAPLALMAKVDVRLGQLLRVHLDGVPLDLAASMLPWGTRLSPGLGMHLHLHSRALRSAGAAQRGVGTVKARPIPKRSLLALLDSLRSCIAGLSWQPGGTEWLDYYTNNNNYSDAGMEVKLRLVAAALDSARPAQVWDLGGNVGRFSRLAAERGAFTVCWDIDPGCVESNYQHTRQHNEKQVLPLLLDLTNPPANMGWAQAERMGFAERAPVDMVLALGLIHHLAIANNVPLPSVMRLFARLGRRVVVEFVPKEDSQVQKLLSSRPDIFPDYDVAGFEAALRPHFSIESREPIAGTARTLYHLRALTT